LPDVDQIANFFLILLRATAFIVAGPLFVMRGIPNMFKVGFAFCLAVAVFPMVGDTAPDIPGGAWGYTLAAVSEVGVGLLLGFVVTLVLTGARIAGQFVDMQIGFSMSAMTDPMNNMQSTLIAQFLYLVGINLFLVLDGHHLMIMGLIKSYQMVPLSAANMTMSVADQFIRTLGGTMTIALQIAAPVLAVLLICDLTLGFLSRTTPQINVFLTGFLVKIMVGMLVLTVVVLNMGAIMQSVYNRLETDLILLIRALM